MSSHNTDKGYVSICWLFQTVLGKNIQRPAKLDRRLARELKGLADPEDPYDTVTGKTMCTYDFYEGESDFLIFKVVLNLW